MSSKKTRRDPLKTPKVWEKARREKMKIYFNELQEVLPFYDPSSPMSRFEILQKSKIYIKDLQDQNQDLLNGGFDEVYKIKMTKLKQRVKELLKRVDQLTDLLKTANIMIPPLEPYPEGSKNTTTFKWMTQHPKKWTEKINLVVPDDKIKSVLTLIKDYKKNSNKLKLKKKQISKNSDKPEITVTSETHVQKTEKKRTLKKSSKVISLKSSKAAKNKSPGSQSPSQFKENQPVDFNLLSNNTTSRKTTTSEESDSVPTRGSKNLNENISCQVPKTQSFPTNKVTLSQNVILPSVPNVLQPNTFILTNDGSLVQLPVLNSSSAVLSQNSNLLAPAAVVKPSTELITPLVINKPAPVIVLQKPSPQIFQAAQIINTTPQVIVSKPSVQILGANKVYTAGSSVTTVKALSQILSKTPINKKRITRDSTVTTYVNKIPIPALSKQSYTKKSVSVNFSRKETLNVRGKGILDKPVDTTKDKVTHKQNEKETIGECIPPQTENAELQTSKRGTETTVEEGSISENNKKRSLTEEADQNQKKQKVDENLLNGSEDNVFKPIETDTAGVFCNLVLPNSMNPSLSVSPTAAFLSSFPIVAPNRAEVEDEISERKSDEEKDAKASEEQPVEGKNKEGGDTSKETNLEVSKELPKESVNGGPQVQMQVAKEKASVTTSEQIKFLADGNFADSSINANNSKNSLVQPQLTHCKSWEQFHHETSETFYMPSENVNQINNSVAAIGTINPPIVSYSSGNENTSYKNYTHANNVKTSNNINLQNTINEQVSLENNHYNYLQKGNYMSKTQSYSERSLPGKPCSNNGSMNESYGLAKSQPSNYQLDSGPNYQLLPAKEVSNQRNSRTVNWMTEPDVSNRPPVYGAQSDKMIAAKASSFTQSDNFYLNNQTPKINDCSGVFMVSDQNKTNYQKNEFYGKEQRCKGLEKRADNKCYVKTSQNSYNIFDYNYPANCYGDDNVSKYCQNQSFSGKMKKTIPQTKKKSDVHQVNSELSSEPLNPKRAPDQIITNLDFNSAANQECFTWIPGKNVEWLPSKSFGLDTNLVVPSTLPTLVGDLALGTSTSDGNQKNVNPKPYQGHLKSNLDVNKDYVDISLGATSIPKPMEAVDTGKQYFEPFANLSKNIFDVTNSNMNSQTSKNDYDKISFVGNNNNETIVLKNIFELPVSKSSGSEFSRNKQRTINQSQNTFLSVSQLVEPSSFEENSMKTDSQEPANQSYPSYSNQKAYKSKPRSSHCKFNDRKYHGYKNGSSSYTAEALIRSNSNVNYQLNEFTTDINTNFFNSKANQKPEQFPGNNKIDFEINMKSDFSTSAGQNIYSDFNFPSPVPNFAIGSAVGTDFGNHDSGGNFSAQNNSFFGDFITPEYPLSENVSNSLLLPQCSIALQNPFVIEKRNPGEKTKSNSKQCSTPRNRKHYDCTKTSLNEFPITPSGAIFTTSSIACPTIFTTSACQNLLPVPTQSIPITFSSPSFTTSNIAFPPLSSATNSNYHRFPNSSQNSASGSFLSSNAMFTTCTSKPLPSSHSYSSNPLTRVTNSVVSSSFHVGNVPLSSSSQSSIPFFSLSNPIIPASAPTSSSNSLANFNLSTIFPEINQKGNYHYS